MIIKSSTMKKISSYLLLLALFTVCAAILQAQSRPRRIGQDSKPPITGSASPGSTTPSKPPVLGGATGTTGSRPSGEPASNGPEEVEAGAVVKVNTTLVTLPVSAMDLDGRHVPNLKKA